MKVERMILIAFLGNYLVNNVAAGLASLVPASQGGNPLASAQYLTFVVLAAVVLGIMAWWYLMRMSRERALGSGAVFGVVGFVVAVATAFLTGIASVLLQTGSASQLASILPRFGPYLANWTTLILLGLWVVPALVVGAMMQRRMSAPAPMQRPM